MNAIGAALGPVFLLILSGALLRRLDLPGEHFWPNAERLTYYLLFPALLVYKLATAAADDIALGNIFGNIAFMLLAGTLLLYLLRGRVAADMPAFTSVYQGSIRFNTYIGLACVNALYGDPGVVAAAIAIAMLIPLINLLCVSAFHLVLHRGSLRALAGSLLRNPLILACVIGIVLNRSGIGLPGWTADTLALLGSAALPMGLLAVGVALQPRAVHGRLREVAWSILFRFGIMPVLMLAGLHLMPVQAVEAHTLLLFACLPTASASYILSRQLGGDSVLMANTITVQTLAAFGLIPLWLTIGQALL
jgi:hypothetical protein